jgi:hypothetical protein
MCTGIAQAMCRAIFATKRNKVLAEHALFQRLVGQGRTLTDRVPEIDIHRAAPHKAGAWIVIESF